MAPQNEITAVVATTHPLEKYNGRFRATREDLEELAEAYRAGQMRMNFGHDPSQPSDASATQVVVAPTDDGEWKLVVTFVIDSGEWEVIARRAEELGLPSVAMSYARTIEFAAVGEGEPALALSADAAAFTQDEILDALRLLPPTVPASAGEYVQFALVDEVVNIVIVLQQSSTAQSFAWATYGALLLPTLKKLRKTGHRIRYRFLVRRDDGPETDVIATADTDEQFEEIMSRLNELEQLVDDLQSEVWEFQNRGWFRRALRR